MNHDRQPRKRCSSNIQTLTVHGVIQEVVEVISQIRREKKKKRKTMGLSSHGGYLHRAVGTELSLQGGGGHSRLPHPCGVPVAPGMARCSP